MIARHRFERDWLGRERCACGRSWPDIAGASEADVGQLGWSCSGTLTRAELAQIETERDRRWRVGLGRGEEREVESTCQ